MVVLKKSMPLSEVDKNLLLLNAVEIDLFLTFGLRQTKWFFEKDYNRALPIVPFGSVIEGINTFGRIQAKNIKDKKRYGFFSHDCTWSEANEFSGGGEIIKLSNLEHIYNVFSLKEYEFNALTHVPKEYIEHYKKNQDSKS